MNKLCDKDERTLQRFHDHLMTFCKKETADEYVNLILSFLEKENKKSLDEFDDDTIEKLLGNYTFGEFGGPEYQSLIRYGYFLDLLPHLDPANEAFIDERFHGVLPIALESRLRLKSGWYVGGALLPELFSREIGDCRILFKLRKKKKTDWLEEALSFIDESLKDNDRVKELHEAIDAILNANDDRPCDGRVRTLLRRCFGIISDGRESYDEFGNLVEEEEGSKARKSVDFLRRRKAQTFLNDPCMKNDPLIEVLQGEYIDGETQPTIVLYLANILDFADHHGFDPVSCVESAFAHEAFTRMLYGRFPQKSDEPNSRVFPKGFDDHFPGKIVKESLASFFEWYKNRYSYDLLPVWEPSINPYLTRPIADFIQASWTGSVAYCPKAGAAKIRDHEHFNQIFNKAVDGPEGLFYAAYELLK